MAVKASVNMNGHILCAVDVETTGLDYKKHDIIQICILPLDSEMNPSKDIAPFNYMVAPRLDRMMNAEGKAQKVHGIDLMQLLKTSLDCWTVADRLMEWHEKLPLGMGKKLCPLAHNWVFDRDFIREWLGPASFEFVFSGHYRCLQSLALSTNDCCDWHAEQAAFTRYGLGDVCRPLQVEIEKAHDALWDCIATAEAYKRLVRKLRCT